MAPGHPACHDQAQSGTALGGQHNFRDTLRTSVNMFSHGSATRPCQGQRQAPAAHLLLRPACSVGSWELPLALARVDVEVEVAALRVRQLHPVRRQRGHGPAAAEQRGAAVERGRWAACRAPTYAVFTAITSWGVKIVLFPAWPGAGRQPEPRHKPCKQPHHPTAVSLGMSRNWGASGRRQSRFYGEWDDR